MPRADPAISWAGAAAVLVGTLGVPLDSAVNVDFPFITGHFHLAIADIRWIVISYTLTSASLLLVLGRISDLIGHRRVFLAGTLLSAAAFALCGMAPSYAWLLAARVAQGVGAGLVMACGAALITAVFPDAARARALGLYTFGFGLGGALGPVAGAVLIAHFGWGAVFWARVPFALAGALAGLTLPPDRRAGPRPGFNRPGFDWAGFDWAGFDWAGAMLLVAAIVALLAAFNQLTAPVRALGALGLAGALGAGFVAAERRAEAPLIDLALFHRPGFARVNLAAIGVNLASFAVLLLVPFALARMAGLPAALDGLMLAAAPAGVAVAGPLAGRLAGRVGAAALLRGGAGLCALGLAGIALVPGGAVGAMVGLSAAMVASGLGAGVFQVAYFEVLTGTIPRHDRGVAGSLGMLTRSLGIVAGASLLIALFAPLHAALGFTPALRLTFLCAAGLAAAMAAMPRR